MFNVARCQGRVSIFDSLRLLLPLKWARLCPDSQACRQQRDSHSPSHSPSESNPSSHFCGCLNASLWTKGDFSFWNKAGFLAVCQWEKQNLTKLLCSYWEVLFSSFLLNQPAFIHTLLLLSSVGTSFMLFRDFSSRLHIIVFLVLVKRNDWQSHFCTVYSQCQCTCVSVLC